jgi:hypothetical protein
MLATLPARIRFYALIPYDKRAEIVAALVPLADDGYAVTVVVPDERISLGWRVLLDALCRHASLRLRRAG